MNFSEQADLARKAESVINSCTRKKHLPATQKYAKLALKRVDIGSELWHTLNAAIAIKERAIKDKPRYRMINNKWVQIKSSHHSEIDIEKQRASLMDAAFGRRGQAGAGNSLSQFGQCLPALCNSPYHL